MHNLILIGLGGGLGSILRYLLSGAVQQWSRSIVFPFGTLAVNLLGCFVIGFCAQLAEARGVFTSEARAFVFVGMLGGFTTFSTFGNETMSLLRASEMLHAALNVVAHLALGLLAVWLGRALAYLIWR